MHFEYEFKRPGQPAAKVSRAFFSPVNAYGIDILRGEEDITIQANAVVIDMVGTVTNEHASFQVSRLLKMHGFATHSSVRLTPS